MEALRLVTTWDWTHEDRRQAFRELCRMAEITLKGRTRKRPCSPSSSRLSGKLNDTSADDVSGALIPYRLRIENGRRLNCRPKFQQRR